MATLGIRINDNEYAALRERADSAGVSMGKLLKSTAINKPLRVIKSADPRLLYLISTIANNINQLARAANVANKAGSLSDAAAKEIYAALCDIDDDIAEFIR